MSLGNLFSQKDRLESLQRQFKPGLVMYLYCSFTIPKAKNKYLLLLDVYSQPSFFIINSNISEYYKSRKHLLHSQVLLKASEYGFLSNDSYIDCTKIVNLLSLDVIIKQTTGTRVGFPVAFH